MGIQIEDGRGTGALVSINHNDNRLKVNASIAPRTFYKSRDDKKCFTWSYSYDYSANDTIILVSNSSTTDKLYIHWIGFSSDTTTAWQVHSPTYPTLAGTALTAVNSNRTSGITASAEAYGNETGNTQANVLCRGITLANTYVQLPIEGTIILGYHNCIALDFTTTGTLAVATICGWFEEDQ